MDSLTTGAVSKVNASKLIDELTQLRDMLCDPHPGLYTWMDHVQQRIASVGALMDQARNAGVMGLVER